MKRFWSGAVGRILIGIGFFAVAFVLTAGLFALEPRDIDQPVEVKSKPLPVKIAEAPPAKEEPPPPPKAAEKNTLAELAPQSSSALPDLGGGVGFGSGGAGPAIAGGGGFGGDAAQLVKDQGTVDRPPRAVSKAPPEYPPEARSKGISGFVTLKIYVGTNGVIENMKVEQSEPAGFFDQAAMRAVRSWRFEPAVSKGATIAAWTTQKIKFELN